MFCIECGKTVKEEAKFCSSCGTQVDQHGKSVAQAGQVITESVAPVESTYATSTADIDAEPAAYANRNSQPAEQCVNQVRPWVRYWARMLDFFILTCLTIVFLFLDIAPLGDLDEPAPKFVFVAGIILTWIIIETLVLGVFGTTPGKSLFKIKLTKNDGSLASLGSVFSRTLLVWIKGLGLAIPIVWIFTMLVSYFRLKEKGTASWDASNELKVTHGRIGGLRVFLVMMLFFVLAFGLSLSQIFLEAYFAQSTHSYSAKQINKSTVSPAQLSDGKMQNKRISVLLPFEVKVKNSALGRYRYSYGYIDTETQQFAILPQFRLAGDFSANGLAPVLKHDQRKWGYVNSQGEMVIPFQFDEAEPFADDGLARVKKHDQWGYINSQGEVVIPIQFDGAWSFADNGLAVVRKHDQWGYINRQGKVVIPLQFEEADAFAANGLAAVERDGKWGYINSRGKVVIPFQFEWVHMFAANGLAAVKRDGQWGYINSRGKVVIPLQFEWAYNFTESGLAAVRKDDKMGYVNNQGEVVIPYQFYLASGFSANGLAVVTHGEHDQWGYINRQGKVVIPLQFESAYSFSVNGLAKVLNEYFDSIFDSIIDESGKKLIYKDRLCGLDIVRNSRNEIIWPLKSAHQICGESN